ncbi:arabinofuranosidase catalytic domain-containing protein, partial [Streptomyces sp. SL13]
MRRKRSAGPRTVPGSAAGPARRYWRTLLSAVATLAVVLGALISLPGAAQAAGSLPCDIYAAAGTPCVAAHSTTRALFSAYDGPLYQVTRASDNTTTDIGLLATGGYANAAAQDTFCANTTCRITKIYDQTSRHNDLNPGPAGTSGMGADRGAD